MSVDLTVKDSLAELVLNRPDKLNAVGEAMARELGERLDSAENQGVRAILIRGEGAGFCPDSLHQGRVPRKSPHPRRESGPRARLDSQRCRGARRVRAPSPR